MKAEQGMVRIQATMIRSPQTQRTERTPLAEPTPRIAPVMAWVVLMGIPLKVAEMIVAAIFKRLRTMPASASNCLILRESYLAILRASKLSKARR